MIISRTKRAIEVKITNILPRFTSVLIYLVSQVLSFKFTKQASKIIADTTFNSDTNLRDKAKLYNGVHK